MEGTLDGSTTFYVGTSFGLKGVSAIIFSVDEVNHTPLPTLTGPAYSLFTLTSTAYSLLAVILILVIFYSV